MKRIFIALCSLCIFLMCSEFSVENEVDRSLKELDYNYNNEAFETAFTDDIVQLGRVLFYDEILSRNGKVSCASCHQQMFSFGDNLALSDGFLDGKTIANTPSLINNHFNDAFFWNGSRGGIQWSVIQPIFNELEMGLSYADFSKRIKGASYYDELIENAYGNQQVTRLLLSEALAQFVGSMILSHSKYDKYTRGEYMLSNQELIGMDIFNLHCNSCHPVLDGDYYEGSTDELTDNGLPIPDSMITKYYSFFANRVRIRVPSLRNLSTTAPYMHDGRFSTLRQVIDHYNTGVTKDNRASDSVDSRLLNNSGSPKKLGLSDEQKSALEAFLLTLDDASILTDERFSNPFAN